METNITGTDPASTDSNSDGVSDYNEFYGNTSVDEDALVITKAIVNDGPKLKRWMPAAMGRATPVVKRTSHVEIIVAEAVR